MNSRIYVVESSEGKRLVRATSAAQAMRFVAAKEFKASVPDQDTLVKLAADGIKVEEANG